jgi:hypothetical protein
MIIPNRPELSLEERKLPLSKYYDLPLNDIGPLYQQIIDAGPMEQNDALKVENLLDHLQLPGVYRKVVFGYCLMDDGCGFLASYSVYPNSTPEMMRWYFRWINIYSKNQPRDKGNLRYKIWCPADHITHGFINEKEKKKADGIYTIEALDLEFGKTPLGPIMYTVRYPYSLRELGLSEQREKELADAGVWVDPAVEKFFTVESPHTPVPGTHLCLTMSRPHPLGGMEKYTVEWIGYGVKDGKIYFDKTTPSYQFTEDWLKMALRHTTVEAQQLSRFLPELYAEYHDKPDDAD